LAKVAPKAPALGDLEEVDGAAALGNRKNPGCGPGFLLYGTVDQAAMAPPGTPEQGRVSRDHGQSGSTNRLKSERGVNAGLKESIRLPEASHPIAETHP
jgi:hypothetical protein